MPYSAIAGVIVNTATLNQRTPFITGNPLRTMVFVIALASDVSRGPGNEGPFFYI